MPEIGFTMKNILIFGDIIYYYLWFELPERELLELLELPERELLLELPDRELPEREELLDADDDLLLGEVDDDLPLVLPELLLPERLELL